MFLVKCPAGPAVGAPQRGWSAGGKLVTDSHLRGGTDRQAGNVAQLTSVVLIPHHALLLTEGGLGDPGSSGEMTNSHTHTR